MTTFSIVQNENLRSFPYELTSLRDEGGTLSLDLLGCNDTRLMLSFDSCLFYSKQDEGDALRTLQVLRSANALGNSVLLKASNSRLLEWFSDETFNVRNPNKLMHYISICINDIINVIFSEDPDISNEPT